MAEPWQRPSGRRGDRGQSVSINYTLSLMIVTLLMAGLFISMGGYLEDERTRATRSELDVLGNRIAADIAAADRLAETSSNDAGAEVRVVTRIPEAVAGTEYYASISSSGGPDRWTVSIELVAPTVNVERTVTTTTRFEVVDSRLSGGRYRVVYDGAAGEIEVNNA